MKKQLFSLFSLAVINVFGQGFPGSNINWPAPDGGKITGASFYGYNAPGGVALNSDNTGSQSWILADMNGDNRQDLVVTAQLQGGDVTCFSPGLNQYWKVYLNNVTGFDSNPVNWNLPNGGKINGGIIYGFDNAAGTAFSFNNSGSQTWSLMDLTGDKRPDLVITAQLQGGQVTCFSPGSGQYWKVYVNTGSSFAANPINWNLPNGGKLTGGITYGYNSSAGLAVASDNTGSQSWSLMDMNGDTRPDLVITAQLQGGEVTCFSPGSGQYWKVFLNTGNAFDATPSNWNLPNGGRINGGVTYGYNHTSGTAVPTENTGSQTWSTVDMTGDGKPDLVVAAQLQAGYITCFSPGSNQYWKLFPNNGSGFDATPQNWNLPNGGLLSGGVTYGYNSLSGTASSSDNTGSQTWSVTDLNGDGRPDLIIAAQLQGGEVTCFSPGSGQYWKVFGNAFNSFSMTPLSCVLPNGGRLNTGVTYGFNNLSYMASPSDNSGSQTWSLANFNGDSKPDLIISGQLQAGKVTSFSPTSMQYWKVYVSDFETGISENSLNTHVLSSFPNPNSGAFVIKSSGPEKLSLVNDLGQTIKSVDLNAANDFTSEITGLQSGVYFIVGSASSSKIVVLK